MQKFKEYILKNKTQISLSVLSLSLICLLLLGLNPEEVSIEEQLYDKTDHTIGELVDGTVVEQVIEINNEECNEIRILVATYNRELKDGTLTVSLLGAEDDSTVATKSWNAVDIKDNTYLNLPVQHKVGKYLLRINSEGFSTGNAPTLFLSSGAKEPYSLDGAKQDTSISLSAGVQHRAYNINGIFIFIILFLISGCFFIFQNGRAKAQKVSLYLLAMILIITGGLLLTAYQTTNQWNPQMLYRLWTFHPQSHKTVNLTINNPEEKSEYNYGYRSNGSIKTIYKSIHLSGLNDDVILLTLNMDSDSRKQQYDFSLYFNSEGKFDDRQKVRKTYHGQEEMYIVLQEKSPVREVRLDAGYTKDLLQIEKETDFIKLKSVVINDLQHIIHLQQKAKTSFILNSILIMIAVIAFAIWKRVYRDKNGVFVWKNNFYPIKVFIIVGVIFAVLFTFILPIYQAPDEMAHLVMIGKELGYSTLAGEMFDATSDMDVTVLANLSGERVDRGAYFEGMDNKMAEKVVRDSFEITPQILRHLPQDIGIEIGLLLNLSAYWIFIFGRLSALTIYLFLSVLALRLIPIKKTLLMIIMLCPMMIQQAASLSYDSLLLSLCLLFISYILYLRLEKNIVGWKELLFIGMMFITISVIKIPYALLAGLILIIPLEKFKLPLLNKMTEIYYKKQILVAGTVIMFITLWLISKISYGKIIYAFLIAPEQSVRLILKTFYTNWEFYATSLVGNFGWLDTPVSGWFVWFIFLFVLLSAFIYADDEQSLYGKGKLWNQKDMIIIWGTFIGTGVLITISMITWSFRINYIETGATIGEIAAQLSQISIIEGIQGRYFLPIILLPLLTIHNKINNNRRDIQLIGCLGIIVVICYTIFTLLNRYWIV